MQIEIKTIKEFLQPDSDTPEKDKAYVLFREPSREALLLLAEAYQNGDKFTPEIEKHIKKRTISVEGVELSSEGKTYKPEVEDWYNWPGELVGMVVGAYYRAVNREFLSAEATTEQAEKN